MKIVAFLLILGSFFHVLHAGGILKNCWRKKEKKQEAIPLEPRTKCSLCKKPLFQTGNSGKNSEKYGQMHNYAVSNMLDVCCSTLNGCSPCGECHLFHTNCLERFLYNYSSVYGEFDCPVCNTECNGNVYCPNPLTVECYEEFKELFSESGLVQKMSAKEAFSLIAPYLSGSEKLFRQLEEAFPMFFEKENVSLEEFWELKNVLLEHFQPIKKNGVINLNDEGLTSLLMILVVELEKMRCKVITAENEKQIGNEKLTIAEIQMESMKIEFSKEKDILENKVNHIKRSNKKLIEFKEETQAKQRFEAEMEKIKEETNLAKVPDGLCAICQSSFQNEGLDADADVVCVTFEGRVDCLQCHLFHRACYRDYHTKQPQKYKCMICKRDCDGYAPCVNPFIEKNANFYLFAEKLLEQNGKMTKQKMLSAISPFVVIDEQSYRDKIENNFPLWLASDWYSLEEFEKFIDVLAQCFEINKKSNLDLNNDRPEEFKARLQEELFDLNRKFKDSVDNYEKEKYLICEEKQMAIDLLEERLELKTKRAIEIQERFQIEKIEAIEKKQFWTQFSAEQGRTIESLRESVRSEKNLRIEKENEINEATNQLWEKLRIEKERDAELLKESVQSEKKLRIQKENELNEATNELWNKFCDVSAKKESEIELLKERVELEEKLRIEKENEVRELKELWNQDKNALNKEKNSKENSEKWQSFTASDAQELWDIEKIED